jgi:hypothetical protein
MKHLNAQWKLHPRADLVVGSFASNYSDELVLANAAGCIVFGAVMAACDACLTIIQVEYDQSSLIDSFDRPNMPFDKYNVSF